MPEANAQAISAGGWRDETKAIAVRPEGLVPKLHAAWRFLSPLAFRGAVFYPYYSMLQQLLRRLTLPYGENISIYFIGVAGIFAHAYVLFGRTSSDEDGWLMSVVIPLGLSLIAGLVCAWISA
jgi:hypothetical protein